MKKIETSKEVKIDQMSITFNYQSMGSQLYFELNNEKSSSSLFLRGINESHLLCANNFLKKVKKVINDGEDPSNITMMMTKDMYPDTMEIEVNLNKINFYIQKKKACIEVYFSIDISFIDEVKDMFEEFLNIEVENSMKPEWSDP